MSDGFDLFFRHWKPVGDVKRVVVCIHGGGGHSESWRVMAQDLAEDESDVYALDVRGFGNSKEGNLPRGDTSGGLRREMKDLEEVIQHVRNNNPGKKIFMAGHSAGANDLLYFASNHPDSVDGLVLAAPGVTLGFKIPLKDQLLFPFLMLFAPKTMYDFFKNATEEMKRSDEFKVFAKDPLSTQKFSVRLLASSRPSFRVLQNASNVKAPTLIIQGDSDKWTLASGGKKLFTNLAAKDKSMQTFPDADHSFYGAIWLKLTSGHDPEKVKQVTDTVREWLNSH